MKIHCPICKKETVWEGNPFRPFCSERCKLIDLGAWISGDYVIPGKLEDESQKEQPKEGEEND